MPARRSGSMDQSELIVETQAKSKLNRRSNNVSW
jgi:hypothetical protein